MKWFCQFTVLVTIICLITSCGGRGSRRGTSTADSAIGQEATITVDTPREVNPIHDSEYTVNVYLENSGSMNGFINQNSEFQDAFQRLTALLKHHYEESNLSMNYINTKVHPRPVPTNVDLLDFAEQLVKPNNFKTVGNVGSTDLNNIVEMVLQETEESEISILISDCIYSISGSGTTASMLASCKNKTMSHFLDKTRSFPDLSTLLIAMRSTFSGKYWDYKHPSGTASQVLNCSRPYYICVLGSSAAVKDFNEKINVAELNGYSDRLLLTNVNRLNVVYSTLATSYKVGQFRMRSENTLSDVRKDRYNNWGFAVAANLSTLPMTSAEKENVANYETSNQNYLVTQIIPIEANHPGISPNDKDIIQKINATHLICVANSGPLSPINLQIKIKNTLPVWVHGNSSVDDTGIEIDQEEQTKTFGLEYFIKGIFDAYRENTPDKDYLETLEVEIKQ